jgi:hypothetical protein
VAIDGGDWTWKMMKEPAFVESGVGDRSLRFSNAQRRAFMLSSLPSTATITTPRFPYSDIAFARFDLDWIIHFSFYILLCSCFLWLSFWLLLSFVDFLLDMLLDLFWWIIIFCFNHLVLRRRGFSNSKFACEINKVYLKNYFTQKLNLLFWNSSFNEIY